MSKYNAFASELPQGSVFDCVLLIDEGPLSITLKDADREEWKIVFSEPLAYLRTDEGDRLNTLNEISSSAGAGKMIYVVEQSDFLRWFESENYGIRKKDKYVHYLVAALNDMIDVISLAPPIIFKV